MNVSLLKDNKGHHPSTKKKTIKRNQSIDDAGKGASINNVTPIFQFFDPFPLPCHPNCPLKITPKKHPSTTKNVSNEKTININQSIDDASKGYQ